MKILRDAWLSTSSFIAICNDKEFARTSGVVITKNHWEISRMRFSSKYRNQRTTCSRLVIVCVADRKFRFHNESKTGRQENVRETTWEGLQKQVTEPISNLGSFGNGLLQSLMPISITTGLHIVMSWMAAAARCIGTVSERVGNRTMRS